MTTKEPSLLWLYEHKRVWHMAILMLLLLAIFGSWTFDLIMVPSKYACSPPFVPLKGDYCGIPLSGLWIIAAVVGEFTNGIVRLMMGTATLADLVRIPLTSLLVLLPLLPFFSTLLLILPGYHPGKQVFHLAAWALAVAATLGLLLFAPELPRGQLWGLWLYAGLAPIVLILEVVTLTLGRRSSQVS